MPTYEVDVGGKTYEVDAPDPTTAWQWANYTNKQSLSQPAVSTKPAGFSFKDLATAFGQGAVGSTEAIANVAGAGNIVSQGLGSLTESLQKQYSPERQAEMQRQQDRMKKAEESGSTWEEIKAGVQNVYEAPLQSVAQGLGSFVPYVPAMFAGPAAAALGLTGRALTAAKIVEKAYAPLVGTAQGAGTVKGAIYDAVYKAEKESGIPEDEARQKADAAQNYAGKNLDQIALGAGLGYVASKGGVEKFLTKEGREKAGEKALLPRVGGAMAEETLTEGAQGGQERLAQNIALQRTGRDVPTFQGVAGQAIQEGIIGGLTAGPVSAISGGKSKEELEQERLKKERDAFEEQRKAFIAQQEKTKENLQVPETLALPAPSKKIEPVKEEASLVNPLGNITKEELGPEVSGYVDQYRKSNNLPPLQSYSIEDVKDAMTQVNPEGEKGALDSILTAKTGFSGEEKYTPEDVINAAVEKNIAHETNGFQDFLQRTTGERDLNAMSEPQLYSAFKALSEMKRESTDEQIVLPEGSNASRFTQEQYDKGRSFVTQQLASGEPIVASPTREALKGVTGLKTDRDVHTLLQALIKNEDLNVTKAGDDYEIAPATPIKDVRAPLPQGYSIEEGTYEEGEVPAGFEITPEGKGKPLTTVDLEAEVAPKIERLTGLRQQEAAKMLENVNRYSGVVKAGQSSLDGMEARGLSGTEAFAKAKAQQARRQDILSRRIQALMDRIEEMSAPLKSKPVGKKAITSKKHTLYKDGKALGTFPSRLDAESSMLTQLSDQELDQLSSDTRFGGITDRATKEKERRKAPAGLPVKGTEAGLAKAGVYTQATPEMAELEKKLVAALSKFGLKDVALKVVRAIENNAEGSYEAKLIKIALDAANPVRTMRHEAIHALKELGFFTKDQWRVLEKKASDEWVQKYLAGKTAVYEGKQMSRLDAYRKMGLSESELLEEAIADAFGDFDVNKAPPGLMMALLNKLRNFFKALRQALTGAGFESAEDIFGKIETGKLDKQMDKADKAGSSVEKKQEKLSLYGEGVPLSTRGVMDRQTTVAQQELGLKTEAVRNRFNNVREIAIALNQHTKDNYGVMDPNALTSQDSDQIAKAIADEVAYQLQSTSKTGTGLGWYSNNYPKAVRRLAKRFPELGNNEHAQSVFSALVAVTSNGERVAKNIDNAIKLYAKLRDGKPLVAMGNRRATALQNNLVAIRDLLKEHGTDFKQVLLKEITVKEMNANLREMGEETDSSYLADTVVPAAAVYFGPKLGAFYANLSGSEGYLTMDLWWTRSINRMRGLLMPKATEASIAKFRDMMDQPSATREEVVAATIPLRNKYEEYGWMTELEHLVKSKEPAKKIKKDAWFDKAEREAGDAYEQLLFEHKLEKMANTIFKNEFEMLEEAPFTATDRKFMYDAARKAQQLLRNEDINLTLADIQAALWYYEKRLYEKLSGRKADDIGYEEAIIAQAGKGDGRARPSVVFSEQPDGRDEPGGKVPVSEQVREEPSKGEKLSLRDATDMFDPDEVKKAGKTQYKSRYKLINISIYDFLRLAKSGKQDSKLSEATSRVKEGVKFTSIPYLYMDREGDNLRVTGHEGRHRAMALQQAGYSTMPVEIRSYIRWSEQTDPDSFDYQEKWPERILSEEGAANENFSIAMPFTREQAPEDYQVSQKTEPKFSLRDVKSEIESLPNGSKIFSAIKRTTTTRENEGFIERITSAAAPDKFSKYRAQALDRYNQLSVREKELAESMGGIERMADNNAHAAALMSDLHSGVTAQVLGVDDGVGGVPVYDKGYTTVSNLNGTVKGPIDIFRKLAAYGDPAIYQAYQFWSAAKRGKRLLAEGKEENITPQDIAFAKELERKYPEFVDIQKDWIKFNNGLVKYMVDTGVISDAMGKEWTKYSDYIPFYRQLDGEKTLGPNIFQSISGVKAPKKLKGSEAPLADFLETVVRNTHAAVQAGMKNVAAQRAGQLAVQVGIGEKLDHVATGADIVTALENGKQVSYRVGDDLFVDAVKSLNIPELPFMSFLTAPANLLRNLVTKDPGFMLANLMRDSVSAYVTSGANIKPMVDTIQNFTKAVQNKSPEFEVLKRAGVVGGYDYSQGIKASTESFEKELRKRAGAMTTTEKRLKPVTGIWDFLEKGTEASDAATRIAVYKDTLKQTGNEAEALLRSLEVMNFNRKGSSVLIRVVTAAIPFLNARMQGLDILYRAGIRPVFKGTNPTEREKQIQRTFFVRGAMLMGLSLMYAIAVKDDPDYEKQEEETKDNNWLLTPLGIRIPTPFEVGFLFKTVPERIYRWAFSGSDTAEEFADSMKRGLVSTFAFNPIPQAALPILEARMNYSTFTMRPIVGQNMENIDPAYQVGPSTSVMAEKLGKQLGVSPIKIDHIFKGYTGTMGMYLVDIMDTTFDLFSDNPRPAKRFEQTPVLKRFLIDPEARGNVTAYYAFKHSVDEAVRTVNFLGKRLDEDASDYQEKKMGLLGFRQYVSSLDKQMTNLQDQANMIRSSGMPAKEKRDALLEIMQIQNELVSDIREVKKMAKEQ